MLAGRGAPAWWVVARLALAGLVLLGPDLLRANAWLAAQLDRPRSLGVGRFRRPGTLRPIVAELLSLGIIVAVATAMLCDALTTRPVSGDHTVHYLTGQATASHATFGATGLSPDHSIYPYVNFDVQITDGDGELSCDNNALNVVGSGVQTDYTPPTGAAFAHEWECAPDTVPVDKRLACEGSFAGGTTVNVLPTPDGMSITMGGVRSLPYTLPADTFIGNDATCCVNPCCDASP